MALEKELETYKSRLPELKGEEGKFVVVHGEEVTVFGTYEDALNEGYKRYKLEPFLVRKIEAIELVQFVTRLCHT